MPPVADSRLAQRVDDREEGKAKKVPVKGADPADAVFAHQDGRVQVMHRVSPEFREFRQRLTENGCVTRCCHEHFECGRGQQVRDEAASRGRSQGRPEDARMGADP